MMRFSNRLTFAASVAGASGTKSTRLAMNGYQDLLHDDQPREELQGTR